MVIMMVMMMIMMVMGVWVSIESVQLTQPGKFPGLGCKFDEFEGVVSFDSGLGDMFTPGEII